MGNGIPHEAVGASAGVLTYSILCFICIFLVVCMLSCYGEKWSYVTILSLFTAISTLASIIQQIHYVTSWATIKQAQYDKAVKALSTPSVTIGGAAGTIDIALFGIQFYCYNVISLNILFWAMKLFCGSWQVQLRWLGSWRSLCGPASKIFSVLFPGLIIGLQRADAIIAIPALFYIVTFTTMISSMTIGGILLILILYRYVKTRRLLAGHANRGRWWASGGSKVSGRDFESGTTESGVASATQRSLYDRALVIRFTIGFLILAAFEGSMIAFSLFQSNNNATIAKGDGPNLTLKNTLADILFFVPGVTAALMVFFVFGTTKSWRQYLDLVTTCCGLRARFHQRRLNSDTEGEISREFEFERLSSGHKRPVELVTRNRQLADRVKMFSPGGPKMSDPQTGTFPDAKNPSRTGKIPATSQSREHLRTMASNNDLQKEPHESITQTNNGGDRVIQHGTVDEASRSPRPWSPDSSYFDDKRSSSSRLGEMQ